jgi:hypothetical protein
MAGAYFYNVNNHTPEQPVIVSTCAPAAGSMKSSLHLRRDTAVWPYDSVLKFTHLTNQEQFSKESS